MEECEKKKDDCQLKTKQHDYYRYNDCFKCSPSNDSNCQNCLPSEFHLKNVTYTELNNDSKTIQKLEYVVKDCMCAHEKPVPIKYNNCTDINSGD